MSFDPVKWHSVISKSIKEFNPEIDTSLGTIVGDTVILPLAIVREILDKTKDFVHSIYSLEGIVSLLEDDARLEDVAMALGMTTSEVRNTLRNVLDNIASDYGLTRLTATAASGVVYYIPMNPGEGTGTFTVDVNERVKSIFGLYYAPETTVVFDIQNESDWSKYYIPELDTYGFPVTVRCEQSGSIGNIGPFQIDYDFGYYLSKNFDRAVNLTPILGGTDEETDQQLVERIKSKWKGVNLSTTSGLKQLLTQYGIEDVYIAGPGDLFMERAITGAADIYIHDFQILTVQIDVPISEDLRGKTVRVREVPAFKNYMYVRDIVFEGTSIIAERDTSSLWKWSDRSNDTVTLPDLETATFTITYNATISEVRRILDLEENKILGLDVMVREAWPVDFSVICSLTYLPGYSTTLVQQDVKTTLANYIGSLPLGSKVAVSDLINVIEDVSGVDTVSLLQLKVGGTIVDTVQTTAREYLNLTEVTIL